MMNIFPFLHFFSFVAYSWLALYTLIKNPKALVNRLLVALFLCFALWSFTFIAFHSSSTSLEGARLLTNIGSLGWCSFSSIYLWFMLAYTGKTKILKSRWFYLLFLLPVILIYKQWGGFIFSDYVLHWYGWRGLYGNTVWTYLFFIYYTTMMGTGLYLNFLYKKENRSPRAKKQATIIFNFMLVPLVLGSLSDIGSTLTGLHTVPNVANVVVLIWASGVVYAIEKYKFLTITPATAAENIISTMFECLIILDLDGNILSVNRSTSELLGYKQDQLKGKSIHFIINPDSQPGHRVIADETIKNREFLFQNSAGETIPVLFSSSRLKDQKGNDSGIVCLAKDITEQNKLKEEKLRSQKIESIGLLAAGIAQDFNQLLSVIMYDISRAREELHEENKLDKLLASVISASKDASGVAEKMCSFADTGELEKKTIFLSQLLEKIDTGSRLKGTSLEIELAEELSPVMGNEELLLQVVNNLLLNAKEAIQEMDKGHISLTANKAKVGSSKSLGFFLKKGDYIKLSVKDNGCGIDPEYIDNVFDPYFSTSLYSNRKGVGLGLTTCYAIMKRHKGHITVDSEVGKGTCVSIYIPAGSVPGLPIVEP